MVQEENNAFVLKKAIKEATAIKIGEDKFRELFRIELRLLAHFAVDKAVLDPERVTQEVIDEYSRELMYADIVHDIEEKFEKALKKVIQDLEFWPIGESALTSATVAEMVEKIRNTFAPVEAELVWEEK